MSSPMAWRQSRSVTSVASGGESAPLGDRATGDAQCGDKRHPVRITAGLGGSAEQAVAR